MLVPFFLQQAFDSPYCSFSFSICLWVIWAISDVFEPIGFGDLRKQRI